MGFIPTRAGKMWSTRVRHSAAEVHPHSRGENHVERGFAFHHQGSSPLARGKSVARWCRQGRIRFIPTRAGKIGWGVVGVFVDWVHPHSRGENPSETLGPSSEAGSSPLARGKCSWELTSLPIQGFIPTRAGKMVPRGAIPTALPVHPHSRGENLLDSAKSVMGDGSSPLARGKCHQHWPPCSYR